MRTLKEFLLDYNAMDFALEELFGKSEIGIIKNNKNTQNFKKEKTYGKKEKELIESLNLGKNIEGFKTYYLNNMVNVIKNFGYVIGIKETIKIGGKKSILGGFLLNNDKIPLEDFLNQIERNFNAFNILNFSLYGEGEIEGDLNVILYIVGDNIYLIFTKPKDYKKVFEELTNQTNKGKIDYINIENIFSTLDKINQKVFEKNKINDFLSQTTNKVLKIKNKDKEIDNKIEETLSTIQSIKEIKYIIGKEDVNNIEDLQKLQPELLIKKSQAKIEIENFFKSINLNIFEDLDNLIQKVNQNIGSGENPIEEDIEENYDGIKNEEEEEINSIKNALHDIGKKIIQETKDGNGIDNMINIEKFELLSDTEIKKIIYGVFDSITNLLIDNYNSYIEENKARGTYNKLKGKKFSKEFLEKLLEYSLIQVITRNEYEWKYYFNNEVLNLLYNASTGKEKGFNNQIREIIDYLFKKEVDDVGAEIREILDIDTPIKTKDNFKFFFKVQYFLKEERLDINKAINFILILGVFKYLVKNTKGLEKIFGNYEEIKEYTPIIGLMSTLQNLEFEEDNKIERLKELEKVWREYSFVLQAGIEDKKNIQDLAYVYDVYSFVNRVDTFSKQMKELLNIADRILNIYGMGMFVTGPDIEPQERLCPIDIKKEVVFSRNTTFAIVEGAEKIDAIIDKRVVKGNIESLFLKVMEYLFPKSFITNKSISGGGNPLIADINKSNGLDLRGAGLNSYFTTIKDPIGGDTFRPFPLYGATNETVARRDWMKFHLLLEYYDYDIIPKDKGNLNIHTLKLQKKLLVDNKLLEVEIDKTSDEKEKTDITRAFIYMKLANRLKEDLIASIEKKEISKKIIEIGKTLAECNIKKNSYKEKYKNMYFADTNKETNDLINYGRLLRTDFNESTPILPSVFGILQDKDELNLIANGSEEIKRVFKDFYNLKELDKNLSGYKFGNEYIKNSELSKKEKFLLNLNLTPLKIGSFFIEAGTTTAKYHVPMINNNRSIPIYSHLGYTGDSRLLYDGAIKYYVRKYLNNLETEEIEAFEEKLQEITGNKKVKNPINFVLGRALNLIPLTLYKSNRENTNPLKSFQIMSGGDNSLAKKWFEYFWLSGVNVPEDTSYQRQKGAILRKELEFVDKFNKGYGYYGPFLMYVRKSVREFQYGKALDMLTKTTGLFLANGTDAFSTLVDSQNNDTELLSTRIKQAKKLFLDKKFYKEFLEKNGYSEEEKKLFFDLYNSIDAFIGVKGTNLKYKDLVEEGLDGILKTNWEEIEGDIVLKEGGYTIDPHNISSISYSKDVVEYAAIDTEATQNGLGYQTKATYIQSKGILGDLSKGTMVENISEGGSLFNAFKGIQERYIDFVMKAYNKGTSQLINTRGDNYINWDYHSKKDGYKKKVGLKQVTYRGNIEQGILGSRETITKMKEEIGEDKIKQLYNTYMNNNAKDNILGLVSVLNKSYFLKSGLLGKMYVLFTKDYSVNYIENFIQKGNVRKALKNIMAFFIIGKQTFNNFILIKKIFKKHFDNKEIKKVFIDYFLKKVGEDKHLKNIENVELSKIEEKY